MRSFGINNHLLITIIIPVYNVEKYIYKTLDSIFSQQVTHDLFEVIVVNDGTPDHSMNIVATFASEHSNLKIVNQKNLGLSIARNTGICHAQGKYLWFVDSDDWIEKNCLPRILSLLQDCQEEVLLFKIREYDENGEVLKEREFVDSNNIVHCSGVEVILNTARYEVLHTPIQMQIINTDFVRRNELKFVENIYHEDMEFAPRLLLKAKRVAYVPWVSYCYVKRTSHSITSDSSKLEKRLKDLSKIASLHYALMMNQSERDAIRAMSFATYRVVAYFHALCPKRNYLSYNKMYGMSDFKYKRVVLDNLYHDHKWTRPPRQLLYAVCPWLLKKLGMTI